MEWLSNLSNDDLYDFLPQLVQVCIVVFVALMILYLNCIWVGLAEL